MTLFLLLGCGSGQQPQAGKDGEAATGGKSLSEVLMEVGRSAENAFYSFLELFSDTLGFTVTKDTTKQQVGVYFSDLGGKLGKASAELEQVAVKSNTDVEKDGSIVIAIRSAVNSAKDTLNTLKGHLDSLKDMGDANQKVGEAASGDAAAQGIKPADGALKNVYKALKGIVDTADKEGVERPKAGDTALNVTGVDNKDGAKILSTNAAGNPVVGDVSKAAAILATVSGEEMLASIVVSQEHDAELGAGANGNITAVSFAKGGNNDGNLANAAAKAAAVAGGIALRSLVKNGKLAKGAADNATGGGKEVQGVGITAVNKLLGALEDIIKKTVKNVLKTAKEKIDKARDPKAAGNE
ncbi:variable large family protein [Borrelia turicatae]|uniref:variable large family protein n=1 Tax=Borrelia turicatae TaxID=142 RepID=UPI001FF6B049|nr:variable large family protein [Borrelia turicatae]UPA14078.1 variable large family protein [Borrelia turicatae 91E135]